MPRYEKYDASATPPDSLRVLFKQWQRTSVEDIFNSSDVLDLNQAESLNRVTQIRAFGGRKADIQRAVRSFHASQPQVQEPVCHAESSIPEEAFEVDALPGLFCFPSLLSHQLQLLLLDRLLHRDLSNPQYKTNIHLFHHVTYPPAMSPQDSKAVSFFAMDPQHQMQPKDASMHKPVTIARMLERKLRWITLGGQYDWTEKVYPDASHPPFPPDIASLLKAFFPDVDAEAAIINFYTPGDTLSVHRDVSEDCDRGLISISLGCDGLFLIGDDHGHHAIIRLRSGDAVLMTGQSRFAWHAVPKILPDTCPSWLQSWPADQDTESFKNWKDWMKRKRININVRQMRESEGEI